MASKYQHVEQYCNNSEVEMKSEPTTIREAFDQAARESAQAQILEEDYGFGSGVHEVQLAPKQK